jgi:hypothetical protein
MKRTPEGDAIEAAELLEELFTAMGIARARALLPTARAIASARKRAVIGLPTDSDHAAERLAMVDVIRECVSRVRRLYRQTGPELLSADDYQRERIAIVRTWNDAIHARSIVTLAPFCDVCGLPVLLRRPDRGGELSTVCSDKCRETRKKRNRR